MARWAADCAVDKIRDRFGRDAIGYGSVALGISGSVPDEFRKLAEKDLWPSPVTTHPKMRASKRKPSPQRALFSLRTPQRNRNELGETTVNKTWDATQSSRFLRWARRIYDCKAEGLVGYEMQH
jgi:hypothetical protein